MWIACPECHFANPPGSLLCSKCGAGLAPRDEPTLSRTVTTPPYLQEISVGSIIKEKYRITGTIGSGGMGVVYKAEDLRLKRTVALKFLSPALTTDWEARERFVREAQAASELDHPNICTIFEFDETETGQSYIAMAYYPGESLKSRIQRGPLPIREALDIIIQLARGLEKAHSRGIVHRDIKPTNVLVTEDSLAKILDFGLAKLTGATQVTRAGTTMGTVAYMSPEQAQGNEVDQRTDLWSLGVVLYEMLSGQLPFKGERDTSVLYSIVHEEPKRLRALSPQVPPELERIVNRALEKRPESRYSSAGEMLKDLENYQQSLQVSESGRLDLRSLLRAIRRPRVAIPTLLILLAIVALGFWFFNRQARIRWTREELLPKIDQLVEAGWENYIAAYQLAVEAERFLPQDPKLAELLKKMAVNISIRTEPPGARVYMKEYSAPESAWAYLGVSPLERMRLPIAVLQWRIEKEGYETVFAVSPTIDGFLNGRPYDIVRTLDKKGSVPSGMVRVKGKGGVGDFFVDQYEVTNRQFKEFIDKGGYQKKEYWRQRFTINGKELTWEEALKEFVDQTGQPGPAKWEAGEYPKGQGEYPVSGVSWYEAAAYAAYIRRDLPSVLHWGIARGEKTPLIEHPNFASVALLSNFKGQGPAPVGSNTGMTSYGAYDMAGNVREWCWNESPKGRTIRGGAWNDATYMFGELSQASPFDRSPRNGFRCALYPHADRISKSLFDVTAVGEGPDFYRVKPVSDPVFHVYREQFSYDKADLKARTEGRNDSSKDWIKEKVTFDAAYENERVIAYLFLPRKSSIPYQAVVYFPGAESLDIRSSADLDEYREFESNLPFIIKSGRAVLFPVYKGTFERGNEDYGRIFWSDSYSRQYTELQTKIFKDFKRSIDYLETRQDIDSKRLAYVGFSWGGMNGAIIPAVEDRLKVSILYLAGLTTGERPEIAQINYVTRVRIPTLMLNGKYDSFFPYETSAKPMFDLLGTPKEQKVQKLYDTDHYIPRNEQIKETLAWLDRYLGPVK